MSRWWCGCCPSCNGKWPQELEITLAGFADRACSDCEMLNDTYVLSKIGILPAGCCWSYDFPADVCGASGFNTIIACVSKPLGLGYQLEVSLGRTGPTSNVITFLKDFGATKPTCKNWSSLSVPVTPQIQTLCEDDSATCIVTAS